MQPTKTKYKKYYKPRHSKSITSQLKGLKPLSKLTLIATESKYINSYQIEAARQNIRRKLKRKGTLTILIFPDIGLSRKPTSARMGKGKGKIIKWLANIKTGQPIFQLNGITLKEGFPALKAAGNKLPVKVKVYRN